MRKDKQILVLIGLFFLLVIFIFGILSITEKVRQISPAQPVLTVDLIATSTLDVSVRVIETICEDADKIDYSLVELNIGGGRPHYELTITNSESVLYGPYTILKKNSPVHIKVYGGDYFTAVIRSNDSRIWSGTIGLPVEAEICKATPTAIQIITETISSTLPSTYTETITVAPTFTPTVGFLLTPLRNTREPKPDSTNITTPPPNSTSTPPPNSTSTPLPKPTSTPLPKPTSTLLPKPTSTNPPQLTSTPINPHPKECEDGKDNDNDGLIDMQDPQCKRPSDPKEDK